jgi:hypothetical protein
MTTIGVTKMNDVNYVIIHAIYYEKVKQSRYRPGVAQRVPGS